MLKKTENQKFSINYYFKYFVENFKISLKEQLEYKINIVNTLFTELIDILVLFFFGYLIISEFGSLINWTLNDFLLFFFIGNISYLISGLIFFDKKLNELIITGDLNVYLVRPGNIFLKYLLSIEFNTLIYISLNIPFLLYLLYVSQIEFIFLLFLIGITICLTLFFIIILNFNESCSFIALSSRQILTDNFFEMRNLLRTMTPKFFKDSSLKYLFFIVPTYFIGTLIIPLSKNVIPEYFWFELSIMFLLMVVFSIFIFLNWKYGIKKYGAFG